MNEIEMTNSESAGSSDKHPLITWTPEHENIMIEWADKAMCYRWLHSKSNAMFSRLNTWYTIPVIILSTLTGTANFAQNRVPSEYQGFFVMLVGSLNILAGIITTIQQFLKITQLNEAHRVSSISWDKFYRNIKIELAKHPNERIDVKHMIKMSKEEYDRLMETSPPIPEKIIGLFVIKFNSSEAFKGIIKPEICDNLIPTNEFRNPWLNGELQTKLQSEQNNIRLTIDRGIRISNDKNIELVSDFTKSFISLNNRRPTDSEIIDNLREKIDIEVLQTIIDELTLV